MEHVLALFGTRRYRDGLERVADRLGVPFGFDATLASRPRGDVLTTETVPAWWAEHAGSPEPVEELLAGGSPRVRHSEPAFGDGLASSLHERMF